MRWGTNPRAIDKVTGSPAWIEANSTATMATAAASKSRSGGNSDVCVEIVLNNVPTLGESHQAWQLNEISSLIWPSPLGAGVMDPDLWAQTVDVATSEGILGAAPDDGADRTDIAEEALENLRDQGIDVVGSDFERIVVELREGGE